VDLWQFQNQKADEVGICQNWQTRRTQNPVELKLRVGSTPTFGTNIEISKF